MRFVRRFLVAVAVLGAATPAALADEYAAISKTAMSITGDVSMDDFGITFANGEGLVFSDLVADHFVVDGVKVPASVYRVEEPADPKLENGNTLCGSGDVTYIASWAGSEDKDMILATFTGTKAPKSDASLCSTYTYESQD